MKLIAHRGLMDGPNSQQENDPQQIMAALSAGFDVEIDLWYTDNCWMLGHDYPSYIINEDFLNQPGLWIHCKNIKSFYMLKGKQHASNYFWHESDQIVMTSHGNVWTYFGLPETMHPTSICVMPEVNYTWDAIRNIFETKLCYAICSDYVNRIRGWQK
jgi:hypothetical protein